MIAVVLARDSSLLLEKSISASDRLRSDYKDVTITRALELPGQ
jgi:hypothetical protein